MTLSNLHRISPQDGAHYFFGYYDIPAFSRNDQLHLAHRVQFDNRLPNEGDVAEVGFIERGKSTFTPLAKTTAWNFQQGSMLQWFPNDDADEIIFNVRDKSTFGSCILDINSSEKRYYPLPVASVDPLGRYALSMNFSRMYDFRPGYGYAGITDPRRDKNHPGNDGIYLLDFRNESTKLIVSLQQLWELTKQWLPQSERKLLVNHITFNPSGTRFVALVRYFPVAGVDEKWGTAVITANADGSDLRMMKEGYIVASHYHWKSDDVLLIYAQGENGVQLYEWNDRTGEEITINPNVFRSDGHCSYSPDGKYILYDSYPDKDRNQKLFYYNLATHEVTNLGKLYSYDKGIIDIRCDLHPRWSHSGKIISIDSNHEGMRGIYELAADDFLSG